MDNVIEKTKNLIEVFEESDLIKNLDHYKKIVLDNQELLELINKYNTSNDDYEKVSLKVKINSYKEYLLYNSRGSPDTMHRNKKYDWQKID